MACKPVCKLCDKLIISQSVTFAGGNLVINIPAGYSCGYYNKRSRCDYDRNGYGAVSAYKPLLRSGDGLRYPHKDSVFHGCIHKRGGGKL